MFLCGLPVPLVVPAIVADAGRAGATRRFLEFFAANIRKRNTRMAYMTAVSRFFGWCELNQIGQLADIEPLHVAAYVEALGRDFEKPTVKQHLAGIRMLFDWLVTGQVVATNPAHAVRGPKHVVKTGKTTVLDADQARTLLDSIDISTLVGLRDRALIALMTYSFARVSAAVAMDVEDYHPQGKRWWVRLVRENGAGGKRHEMPLISAHHNLEAVSGDVLYRGGRHPGRQKRSPLPLGARAHCHAHGQPYAPRRRLAHGATARGGGRTDCACRQSLVSCNRHHRLPQRRRHARECLQAMAAYMKAPARPSSMIALETRSHSTR